MKNAYQNITPITTFWMKLECLDELFPKLIHDGASWERRLADLVSLSIRNAKSGSF